MSNLIKVKVEDEKLLEFWDDACIDWPEDLIWDREISKIFWAGVKAARMTESNEEIEIKREPQ